MTTSEFRRAQQEAAIRDRKRGQSGANKISGPFNAYLVDMKRSPAWQVLNMPERRMLDRLEHEHNKHGASKNGELIVTYKDFIEARISRKKIKPSQRTIVALGFAEITQQGYGGGKHTDDRQPTKFRLTYFRAQDAEGDGTHEWRRITTMEQADEIASKARNQAKDSSREARNFGAPKGLKSNISVPHEGTETAHFSVPQKASFRCPGGARLSRDRFTGIQAERGDAPPDVPKVGRSRTSVPAASSEGPPVAPSPVAPALGAEERGCQGEQGHLPEHRGGSYRGAERSRADSSPSSRATETSDNAERSLRPECVASENPDPFSDRPAGSFGRQPLSSAPSAGATGEGATGGPSELAAGKAALPDVDPNSRPSSSSWVTEPLPPPAAVPTTMDACLQFASEWSGTKFDRAVEIVTAMVAKLPIERVHDHFAKIAKLHRSGPQKLDLVECAIAKELSDLHPVQPDLFAAPIAPSPCATPLGATSAPAGAALPPTATLFDLAALRQYAVQISAWRQDLAGPTAQHIAREWMTAAGTKRLAVLFAMALPRKRSGAFKFDWIEDLVANPRPLRPARRQARGSSS